MAETAIDLLMTRRSIRDYTDQDVSEGDVQTLLRAAMAAPSAGNEQPWHFVVIRRRATMEKIMQAHPYSDMLAQAPVCIAVLAEVALERHAGYWVQDCSAATMNLLLAAHALGLGAVWLGVHPVADRERAIKQILSLPDGLKCLSLVAVGHPAEGLGPADRFNPERVHEEQW
jgi:nitroreductase